jgi:hypothetical protein
MGWKNAAIGAGVLLVMGCVAKTPVVSPAGQRVQVSKNDPPRGFVEIGPITVRHGHGCGGVGKKGTYEGAYAALRNEAGRLGAHYVRIDIASRPHHIPDCRLNRYKLSGVAFRRTSEPRKTPPPRPAAAAEVHRAQPVLPPPSAPEEVAAEDVEFALGTPEAIADAEIVLALWIGSRITLELQDGRTVSGVLARYRDGVLVLIVAGEREAFHATELTRARLEPE